MSKILMHRYRAKTSCNKLKRVSFRCSRPSIKALKLLSLSSSLLRLVVKLAMKSLKESKMQPSSWSRQGMKWQWPCMRKAQKWRIRSKRQELLMWWVTQCPRAFQPLVMLLQVAFKGQAPSLMRIRQSKGSNRHQKRTSKQLLGHVGSCAGRSSLRMAYLIVLHMP